MKNFFLLVLLFFVLFSSCSNSKEEKTQIYAIKYADSLYSSNYIFHDNRTEQMIPFSWLFYLLEYKGKTILIDTGVCDKAKVERYALQNYLSPPEILREYLLPSSPDYIFLTHTHFDHLGCVEEFKNATIIVQEQGLPTLLSSFPDIDKTRIHTFSDSFFFDDALTLQYVGGHSRDSSVVWLTSENETFLFVGDECYTSENCLNTIPVGTFYNGTKNLEFIRGLNNTVRVLYFHEAPSKKRVTRIT